MRKINCKVFSHVDFLEIENGFIIKNVYLIISRFEDFFFSINMFHKEKEVLNATLKFDRE